LTRNTLVTVCKKKINTQETLLKETRNAQEPRKQSRGWQENTLWVEQKHSL